MRIIDKMVVNSTGWNELISMNIGSAVWVALDTQNSAMNGYLGLIIFCLLNIAVFMRTQSVFPAFTLGSIMYALFKGVEFVAGHSIFGWGVEAIIGAILLLEFAGTIYSIIRGT